jgi:hypothetical protein
MDDFSQVRRILRMHGAHRTVGVSGVASSFRPCRPLTHPLAIEPVAGPLRVSLVSSATNGRTVAAMAAFERIVACNSGLRCNRVDFATAEIKGLVDADCAVVFGGGLQIVDRWSAVDADIVGQGSFEDEEGFDTEVEIAEGGRRHPVVDGIATFIARNRFSHVSHLRPNSTCLLVREWAGRAFPLAWAQERDGRAFYTLLGHCLDFRCGDFVRLVLNAIDWTTYRT